MYFGNGTVSGQNAIAYAFNTKYVAKINLNGYSYLGDTVVAAYVPTSPGRQIPLVIGDTFVTTGRNIFNGRIYSYKLFNRSTGLQLANIYPVTVTANDNSFVFDALYDSINNKFYLGSNVFYCDNDSV